MPMCVACALLTHARPGWAGSIKRDAHIILPLLARCFFRQMAQKATFAAGCFWGVEEAFRTCGKVLSTRVGYTGGTVPSPTYEQVCHGKTGHAEAVEVEFDASRTAYPELLDLFWRIHDPTAIDRQGYDVGPQYRTAIFCHSDEQQQMAIASRDAQQRALGSGRRSGSALSIATRIEPAGPFYAAEECHQQYIMKRGGGAACGLRRPL